MDVIIDIEVMATKDGGRRRLGDRNKAAQALGNYTELIRERGDKHSHSQR